MKKLIMILMVLILSSISVFAQQQEQTTEIDHEGRAGIVPGNPLYIFDQIFDNLQSPESVMREKVSEMVQLVKDNRSELIDRSQQGYSRAVDRRRNRARSRNNSQEQAQLAQDVNTHLQVLARVREQAPEQAYKGIDTAIRANAQDRKEIVTELKQNNPEQGEETEDKIELDDETLPEQARRAIRKGQEMAGMLE